VLPNVGYVCISRPRRILGTVAHNEDRERSTHWPPDKGFLQLTRLIAGLRPRPSLAINPRPSPVTSVACSNILNSPRAAGDTSAPEIIVLGTRGMAHCHRKSVPLSLSLSFEIVFAISVKPPSSYFPKHRHHGVVSCWQKYREAYERNIIDSRAIHTRRNLGARRPAGLMKH